MCKGYQSDDILDVFQNILSCKHSVLQSHASYLRGDTGMGLAEGCNNIFASFCKILRCRVGLVQEDILSRKRHL
jgi:hypothetical protein